MTDEFRRRATDSTALDTRAALTGTLAARDLEAFMLSLLELEQGERIADIGCGRGKQLFVYAEAVGPRGHALGLDVSPESIEHVRRTAQERGLAQVAAVQVDMDAITPAMLDGFDAVVSAYAFYYAQRPVEILAAARAGLRPGGRVLIVAPVAGNNQEFFDILTRHAEIPRNILDSHGFLPDIVLPACRRLFDTAELVPFPNVVTFESPDPLLQWWRSSTFFDERAVDPVTRDVHDAFRTKGAFRLRKEAGAVIARLS